MGFLSAEELRAYDLDNAHGLLFLPGFSTRDEVTEISGRGVGLDVVADAVRKLSGEVRPRELARSRVALHHPAGP